MIYDCSDIAAKGQHKFANRLGKTGCHHQPIKDLADVVAAKSLLSDIGSIFPELYKLPTGLIMPFLNTPPTGWAAQSGMNDYAIVGGGNLYAAGSVRSKTKTLHTASKSHTHTSGTTVQRQRSAAGTITGATASHTHNWSFSYSPKLQKLILAKVTGTVQSFTADAVMLTLKAMTGLTRILAATERSLAGGAAQASDDTQEVTSATATADANDSDHDHFVASETNDWVIAGGGYQTFYLTAAGSHTHSITASIAAALRKAYLGAWQFSSAGGSLLNEVLGLLDSDVTDVPDGWLACDGSLNTVDLRDHYLMLGNSGRTLGTKEGNGAMTVAITGCPSAGAHTHGTASAFVLNNTSVNIYAGAGDGAHSESAFSDGALTDYAPNSYALKAIIFRPH